MVGAIFSRTTLQLFDGRIRMYLFVVNVLEQEYTHPCHQCRLDRECLALNSFNSFSNACALASA